MLDRVVLDTGPLSLVLHPLGGPDAKLASEWLQALEDAGVEVVVPEISDYELRRELLRARKTESVARLNRLCEVLTFQPLTTIAMRRAAEHWARLRNEGTPTARSDALDGDVILAAQAEAAGAGIERVVVATTNVGHLDRLVPACEWEEAWP